MLSAAQARILGDRPNDDRPHDVIAIANTAAPLIHDAGKVIG